MGTMLETHRHRKGSPDQGGYVPPPSQFGNSGFKAFAGTDVLEAAPAAIAPEEVEGLSVVEVFEKIETSDPQRAAAPTFDELIRSDVGFVPVAAADSVDQDDPAWVTRTAIRRSENRRRLITMIASVVLAVLIVVGMLVIWWFSQTPTETLLPGPDLLLDSTATTTSGDEG